MATTNTPIYPQTISNSGVTIVPADTTTKKTLLTAGVNGAKVEYINVASDDTASKNLILYLSDGTNDYLLTWIAIAATSGFTTSIPSVAVLQSTQLPLNYYDSNGNRVLFIKAGWSIKVAVSATMTTAKTMYITSAYSDF
jgi:hypothetical protein